MSETTYDRIPPDIVETIYKLFPLDLRDDVIIAGGAVRDYWHAKDIDLWLLAEDEPSAEAIVSRVVQHFAAVPDLNILPFYPSHRLFKCCEFGFKPAPRGPQKIQIIVVVACDAVALLDQFDISVHQHAVQQGVLYSGWRATNPGDTPIHVTRFDTPYSTLRRYFLLCQRYSVKPHWPDVVQLCKEIVLSEEKKLAGPAGPEQLF